MAAMYTKEQRDAITLAVFRSYDAVEFLTPQMSSLVTGLELIDPRVNAIRCMGRCASGARCIHPVNRDDVVRGLMGLQLVVLSSGRLLQPQQQTAGFEAKLRTVCARFLCGVVPHREEAQITYFVNTVRRAYVHFLPQPSPLLSEWRGPTGYFGAGAGAAVTVSAAEYNKVTGERDALSKDLYVAKQEGGVVKAQLQQAIGALEAVRMEHALLKSQILGLVMGKGEGALAAASFGQANADAKGVDANSSRYMSWMKPTGGEASGNKPTVGYASAQAGKSPNELQTPLKKAQGEKKPSRGGEVMTKRDMHAVMKEGLPPQLWKKASKLTPEAADLARRQIQFNQLSGNVVDGSGRSPTSGRRASVDLGRPALGAGVEGKWWDGASRKAAPASERGGCKGAKDGESGSSSSRTSEASVKKEECSEDEDDFEKVEEYDGDDDAEDEVLPPTDSVSRCAVN